MVADLVARLRRTRWDTSAPTAPSGGIGVEELRELCDRWAADDWRARERRPNEFRRRVFTVGARRIVAIYRIEWARRGDPLVARTEPGWTTAGTDPRSG